jgi:hypothetical protein
MLHPVIAAGTPGAKYPIATPAAMATKIHSVKKRSRNDNVVGHPAGDTLSSGVELLLIKIL